MWLLPGAFWICDSSLDAWHLLSKRKKNCCVKTKCRPACTQHVINITGTIFMGPGHWHSVHECERYHHCNRYFLPCYQAELNLGEIACSPWIFWTRLPSAIVPLCDKKWRGLPGHKNLSSLCDPEYGVNLGITNGLGSWLFTTDFGRKPGTVRTCTSPFWEN